MSTTRSTPARVIVAASVIVALLMLFAPGSNEDNGPQFSTYTSSPDGSEAVYDVLARLGYTVRRRQAPLDTLLDTAATYVIITPAQPLTTVELTDLLATVRGGATLFFTSDNDATLTDSLGFTIAPLPRLIQTLGNTVVAGDEKADTAASFPPTAFIPATVVLRARDSLHADPFMWLRNHSDNPADTTPPQLRALMLGHRVGKGYAVGITPMFLLSDQFFRDPRTAVAIVRALDHAEELGLRAHSSPIIFDEYHHGFGRHADVIGAIETALTDTPAGRMAIQGIIAALVLLLAVGARPLPPVATREIRRRSPLEHVGALAHAYSQVQARQLAVRRLVRGLRRRHPLGVARSAPDTAYLATLRARIPDAAADVDRVTASATPTASTDSSSPAPLAQVGASIANIERKFDR